MIVILTDTYKFLVVFPILMLFMWWTGFYPSWTYLALVPVLLVNLTFIIGLTFVFAAIVPFFLDIRILMDHALRGLFFLSGIFFCHRHCL